jgi:hypothetical protein
MIVYLDYHTSCERKRIPEGSFWSNLFVRRVLLALTFIYPWSVGYARVVEGAHAYNQIFFGFMTGFWLALSWHYLFYDRLLHGHLTNLAENKIFDGANRKGTFVSLSIACLVFWIVVQVVQYIPYWILNPGFYQQPYSPTHDQWMANILANPGCGPNALKYSFFSISIIWSGSTSIGPGAYFGMLIQSYF